MMPPRSVFVGISGASGAPYALRLLEALSTIGCELQVSLSDTGVLVLRHELSLSSDSNAAVAKELLERAGATASVFAPDDLAAPPSSGSSFPDAVVVCPCSVSSAACIALGTTHTLIHRVSDVALKEGRPLIVVPREMPLTQIHLRRLLELAQAGATVIPAMPGFYSRPLTLDDMLNHVVGKIISSLGFRQALFPSWQEVRNSIKGIRDGRAGESCFR